MRTPFALVLCVLSAVTTACRCDGGLSHLSAHLVPQPATLTFANQPLNVSASKTVSLVNDGSVTISVTGVVIQNDANSVFTASLTPTALGAGQSMTLT